MNKKELFELIKIGEGYTTEFKEKLNDSLGKEICAFANASGGKIILGVSDEGNIKGIKLTNHEISRIQDIARNMDPIFSVNIEKVDSLVVIYVPEGKEKPYTLGGSFYIRQGANSQKLKRNEIRELFQKENIVKFDMKTNLKFNLNEDFNDEAFNFFCNKANISLDLNKEHILKNLLLLTDSKPNNSCVLLFSKDISQFFLNSVITCVLYQGNEKINILDRKDFKKDFISNFNQSIIFILRNIKIKSIIKGRERKDIPEIPEEALREAVINAMIHRDYFSDGRIQIDIFSNRIEISNPGQLLFKENDFGNFSVSRNPILVDCMFRAGFVERIGSGILRMKSLVSNISFKFTSNWFRVIFLRDEVNVPVNVPENVPERKKQIILLIKENNHITIKELSDNLNVNEKTIKRDLIYLKNKKLLKRIGPDKGGYWKIIR